MSQNNSYTPTELRQLLIEGKKVVRLEFGQYSYFSPESVSKLIKEIEKKQMAVYCGLDDFTECEKWIYRLLCESAEATGMSCADEQSHLERKK